MKRSLILILVFMSIFISSASSCSKGDENNTYTENTTTMANGKIKITVNSISFTATLLDNNSAKAFKEMLPMTINMVELNNNEKYFDLSNSLPTNSSNPQAINIGDLML